MPARVERQPQPAGFGAIAMIDHLPAPCVRRHWGGLHWSVYQCWAYALALVAALRRAIRPGIDPDEWRGPNAVWAASAYSQAERLASEMEYEAAYWQFYGGW